jgi:hypothetical protein
VCFVQSENFGCLLGQILTSESCTGVFVRFRAPSIESGNRELAIAHKLEMKISDIEFQGMDLKATFLLHC